MTALEAAMTREFAILGEFFAAIEAAQTPDDGNLAGLDLAVTCESDSLALERWEAEGGSYS